jgi:O-antigen/teichoic acid export membrane protein
MGVSTPEAADSAQPAFRPLQAILALGGIQALTMLAGLARTKVLAALLGPPGVGVASVIDQVVSLVAQLGSLSIPFVGLRFLARAHDDDADEMRGLYDALVIVLVLASVTAAATGTGIAFLQPSFFGEGLTTYRTALIVALLGVPPFAIAPLLRNVMAALERHREAAIAAFLSAVLAVGGAAVGARSSGLVGLYIANAIVLVITVAGMQWYLARSLGLGLPTNVKIAAATRALRSQRGLMTFASAMWVLGLTSPLAYLVARSMLLSTHGAGAAGLVAAAYGIAVSIRLVLSQANALYLTPLLNRNTPKPDRIAAVSEYLRILIVLVVLSTLVVVLFPAQWLRLLYSARFLDGIPLVAVFVLAEAVLLVAGVYQALLIGFDDISGFLISTVSGHFITIALAGWLVAGQGGAGVGLAFLAGNSVILLATATRLLCRHAARQAFVPLWPLCVALLAIGGAGWWVPRPGGPGIAWRVAVYISACAIAFLFLRPDERRWILRPWQPNAAKPR